MRKFKVLALVIAFITSVCFATAGIEASATTKKTTSKAVTKKSAKKTVAKATSKAISKKPTTKKTTKRAIAKKTTAPKKKTAVKSTAKKSTRKTKLRSTARKTISKRKSIAIAKSSSRRRTGYSRGSGSTLGSGDVIKMISYAKRYIGVDYNYGRSSSRGFDCSGFTMYVYRNVDINLPHSATSQSRLGLAVDKSQLRAGDLVFFSTVRAGISHVGIYVGNGHFIHASSGVGHVTISSLSDSYYAPRYRGATRILND